MLHLAAIMVVVGNSSSDFTSNPLVDVGIGGIIAAISSVLGIYLTNKQQVKRDKQAYEQQKEREQTAYVLNIKDAKRERLRNSYKVILNAAEEYQSVIE